MPSSVDSNAWQRNTPHSVGISISAIRRTSCSVWRRKRIRSAIVIINSPCSAANAASSGTLAIPVLSTSTISQRTPTGCSPAIRGRSTAASVCPARLRTPPARASSGMRWPGRARSCGAVEGSTRARMVAARSLAEMPVVVPAFASTLTRNAVSRISVLLATMGSRSRCRARSVVIAVQMKPDVWRMKNAIDSGVANSAAMIRSPSFSRSSSSTTMTISPRPMAATASSTDAKVDVLFVDMMLFVSQFEGDAVATVRTRSGRRRPVD